MPTFTAADSASTRLRFRRCSAAITEPLNPPQAPTGFSLSRIPTACESIGSAHKKAEHQCSAFSLQQ